MMAPLKERDNLTPDEAVRITKEAAPTRPPAILAAPDKAASFNVRLRLGSPRGSRSGEATNLGLMVEKKEVCWWVELAVRPGCLDDFEKLTGRNGHRDAGRDRRVGLSKVH